MVNVCTLHTTKYETAAASSKLQEDNSLQPANTSSSN